jgi:hypothetical protein
VDHGFNAFHWFNGRRQSTLLEWFEDLQVCTRESMLPDLIKEGPPSTLTSGAFSNPVLHIWNDTEDPDLPASSDSLCSAIQDLWIREICDKCDSLSRFVMASPVDKTLKEYADKSYYRETLEGDAYVMNGYDTIIESGLSDEDIDEEKHIGQLTVTATAEAQTTPSVLHAWIGTGPAPDCIDWRLLQLYLDGCDTLSDGINLECLSDYTADDRDNDGIRRDDFLLWPCHERGRYFGYRLKIEGTGGGACFSRVNLKIAKM